MVEIETKTIDETIDLKLLREMSFEDICKHQLLQCLKVGSTEPEKLPSAVAMLEKLFKDELPEDYWKKIGEVANNQAEELFPNWRRDEREYLRREIFIAQERFALIVGYVKSKIPQELIASL